MTHSSTFVQEDGVHLRYHSAYIGSDELAHTVLEYKGSYSNGALVVPDFRPSRVVICGEPIGGLLYNTEGREWCSLCAHILAFGVDPE